MTEDYSIDTIELQKSRDGITFTYKIQYNAKRKIADTVKKYVDEICMEEQKILDNIIKILANLEEDRRGRIDW